MSTLDDKIAAAFQGTPTSSDVTALITEAEAALTTASEASTRNPANELTDANGNIVPP